MIKKCLVCGNEIKCYVSTQNKKKYCSVECRKSTTYKTYECLWCGKPYEVAQSRYNDKGLRYRYCGTDCYNSYREDKKRISINNKTYTCKNCGIKFVSYRSSKENTFCSNNCCKIYSRGEKHHSYRSGVCFNNGYKALKVGDKYLLVHRIIMEEKIGRKLKKDEVVHHIDSNRLNNSLDNLMLMSKKEHDRYHTNQRHAKEPRFGSTKKLKEGE